MTPKQLLQYYGTQAAASRALGIKQPSLHQWVRKNKIPLVRQYQIQVFTDGMLVADSQSVSSVPHIAKE